MHICVSLFVCRHYYFPALVYETQEYPWYLKEYDLSVCFIFFLFSMQQG
jgi:hypothetical protein